MALITKQELEDAAVDAQTLEDVANGSATLNGTGEVTSRLGQNIKTIAKVIEEILQYDISASLAADIVNRIAERTNYADNTAFLAATSDGDYGYVNYVLTKNSTGSAVAQPDDELLSLLNALNSEISTRSSADSALQTNIDNEESARQAADATLQSNIDAEQALREAADVVLQDNINLEIFNRNLAAKANSSGLSEFGNDIVLTPVANSFIVYNTGAVVNQSGYAYASINVNEGEVYLISGNFSGSSTAIAVYKNASGDFISYEYQQTGTLTLVQGAALSVPKDAVEMLITWRSAYPEPSLKLAGSQRPLTARDIENLISNQTSIITTLGELSSVSLTPVVGEYIAYNNGSSVTNAGFSWASIEVKPNENILVSGTFSGSVTAVAVFLDKDGQYIGYDRQNGSTETIVDYEVSIPNNCYFMITTWPNSGGTPVLKQKTLFKPTSLSKIADLEQSVTRPILQTDFTDTEGYFVNYSDGSVVASAAYKYRIYNLPEDSEEVLISGTYRGAATALAVFKDASGNFISYVQQQTSTAQVYENEVVSIPENAVTLWQSWPLSNDGDQILKIEQIDTSLGQTVTDNENVAERYNSQDFWKDKTIVWFGTSIPAGGAGGNYPSLVANKLGAVIYNEASGGSAARSGVRSLIDPINDPYGITGASYRGVVRSLSQTLADKQWLYDNWATVYPLLDDPDAPSTVGPSDLAEWQDHSYETRLVARHLGANRKDVYIFDHGHNDRTLSDDITTAGLDSRDVFTFFGAMAFLIDLILNDNPKARILFMGHYEDARKETIVEAQQIVASYWSRPIMPLWERIGWTQQTVETTGEWVNGYWNSDYYGNPVTKTMTEIWLPDDLHPGVDNSGEANEKIAEHIAAWMRTIRA